MGMILYGYRVFVIVAILSIPLAIALIYGIIELINLFSGKKGNETNKSNNKKVNLNKSYNQMPAKNETSYEVNMVRPLTAQEIEYYKVQAEMNRMKYENVESIPQHQKFISYETQVVNKEIRNLELLIKEVNERLKMPYFCGAGTLKSMKEWLRKDDDLLWKLGCVDRTNPEVISLTKQMKRRIQEERVAYNTVHRQENERIRDEKIAERELRIAEARQLAAERERERRIAEKERLRQEKEKEKARQKMERKREKERQKYEYGEW